MKTWRFVFLLACLASCSTDNAPKHPSSAAHHALAAGSPEQTVREYLHWYATNYNKLPANFIETPGVGDSLRHYTVNSQVTKSWLVAVQKSGFFSSTYLQTWRSYFKQYADTLRLHPQNDGPPSGFDYDFLMLSQEADAKVSELQAGTCTTKLVNPTRAIVVVLGAQHDGWREGMTFNLAKSTAGKWLIDTMSIPDGLTQ